MAVYPIQIEAILLQIGGVWQNPGTAFTLNGNIITTTEAPTTGESFHGVVLGSGLNIGTPSDGTVTGAKLAADAVSANTKLASGVVTTHALAASAVTTAKLADSNVTTAKLADSNVTTAKLASDAVTTAKITDANVTTAKLASDAVTTAKLADSSITTAKITDANITTAKLADSSITTAKLADVSVTAVKIVVPLFQCQLAGPQGTILTLSRFGGSFIFINGQNWQISSSGPTISTSGSALSDSFYIYAYISGGAVTLEKSTTAYATDSTYGHKIKSGDPTRTLVGLARIREDSLDWGDSVTRRFIRSYYNDPGITISNYFNANRSTSTIGYVEINSEVRCQGMFWEGEVVAATANFPVSHSIVNNVILQSIGIDGASPQETMSMQHTIVVSGGNTTTLSNTLYRIIPSEGYHYFTVLGLVYAGTGSWELDGTYTGRRGTLSVIVPPKTVPSAR